MSHGTTAKSATITIATTTQNPTERLSRSLIRRNRRFDPLNVRGGRDTLPS
jgi:hypothetical protein